MTDLVRDCSKVKNNTFSEISIPIIQEVQSKIRVKNLHLRRKARDRIDQRIKLKYQDSRETPFSYKKQPPPTFFKFQKEAPNYMEAYQFQSLVRQTRWYSPEPDLSRWDDKDEQTALLVYLHIKKNKKIFKVEEVKRKLRIKESNKRGTLKECDCCGQIGKHKCLHDLCKRGCDKFKKKVDEKASKSEEVASPEDKPEEFISMVQEIIDGQEVKGPQILVLQIKSREDQMELPRIDKSEEDYLKREGGDEIGGDQDMGGLNGVVETERISEIESKSQVSESRRNRSAVSDVRELAVEKLKEAQQRSPMGSRERSDGHM